MSGTEVERILSYFDKIRNLEVLYCESHDREFLENEKCPICEEDERLFLEEHNMTKLERTAVDVD